MCKFILTAGLLTLLAITTPDAFAQATTPQRDTQKETQIWNELAALSPASVETFKQATEALDRGDAKEAVRLYTEVFKKVQNWDVINRRLGLVLMEEGQMSEGLAYLRKAVDLKRSPENLISLAQMMAYPNEHTEGSQLDKEKALLLAVEANAKKTDQTDAGYPGLMAQLALELDRKQEFRSAVNELVARHPDLMVTHFYNAILAANDEQWATAKSEIERAGQMGLPANVVEDFLNSGVRSKVNAWRYFLIAVFVVLAWAAGLLLLFILGGILSKRTLRELSTADPNTPISAEHQKLRSLYRKVINIAGLYYYISIPVVIVLILGVSGAIIYAIFLGGTIPIKLVLILGIGAIVTVYQMIRSLFVRQKAEDPGRALEEKEAPGLWALSKEVAATVGTRPVTEIRVTPGTEVAVYERGGFRERIQDKAERILLIGVGVLNDFK